MKIHASFFLSLLVLFGGVGTVEGAELLVKWRNGSESDEAQAGHAAVGAEVRKIFRAIGWEVVRLPEGMNVAEGLELYRANSAVLMVEANGQVKFRPAPPPVSAPEPGLESASTGLEPPDDPRWAAQWNLRKIGLPAGWAVTTGSSNVVVAVIDTGIDYTHEDLRDNLWRNPGETGEDNSGADKATNGVDDDENGYVDDVYGIDPRNDDADPMDEGVRYLPNDPPAYHGTGCAGIIAGTMNNRLGIAGIAGTTRIMSLRLFGSDNGRLTALSAMAEDILECFNYVLEQKRRGVNVRITSNSWGHVVKSNAIIDALKMTEEMGILSVFAAGNDAVSNDQNWWMPVCYDLPSLIAVAATDPSDQRANFSSFGLSSVEMAAPGTGITTLKTNRVYVTDFTGTSAACPHVAAAAALLLAVKPDATPLELKAALMQSVDPIIGLRGRVTSNGRLNVARALEGITNSTWPPVVVGMIPSSSQTEGDAEISIGFSRPMEAGSVEGGLEFSPPISGTFEWSADGKQVTLRPIDALTRTNYTARLSGDVRDANGITIDGDYDRTSEGSPVDDFKWGFSFPTPNDDFAGARVLKDTTGSLTGVTTNATVEIHEPLGRDTDPSGALSLWYQWDALADGWMTFDTSTGSSLDTIVSVYTGVELASLEPVGYSESFGSRTGGRVSIPVKAGTNYFVCVAGQSYWGSISGYLGRFTLSWYPTPSPAFATVGFLPKVAKPGETVTFFGTNFTGATEVSFNGVLATFKPGLTNVADLRITATVPPDAVDGPILVQTPHGNVSSASAFVVMPPDLQVGNVSNGVVEVSWPATAAIFGLETTGSLAPPQWTGVQSGLERMNGRTYLRRGREETPGGYYRLKKEAFDGE